MGRFKPPIPLPDGHVMRFLRHHPECWVKRDAKTSLYDQGMRLSHVFMDKRGTGMLRVPTTLTDEFYGAISEDVRLGTMPALCELNTDVFRFFLDVDLHLPRAASDELSARRVAACCTREVHRFLSDGARSPCVVLTTPDRDAPPLDDAPDAPRVKRGLHLHFRDVEVTHHEALLMREAIVVALQRDLPLPHVNWTEDVDNCPYLGNSGGLRMVGAPKIRKCHACLGGKEKEDCFTCQGHGFVLEAQRKYAFDCVLAADGGVDDEMQRLLASNVALQVRYSTVRSAAAERTSGWVCFDGCPEYSPLKVPARGGPPRPGKKERVYEDDGKSMQKWPKVSVTDPDRLRAIQAIFRTRFKRHAHDVYANVSITSVRFAARKGAYYAQFSGEGENYCMNIKGRHRSNRVYGVVERNSAYVQCHSAKACRGFRSASVALTGRDQEVLFPDAAAAAAAGEAKQRVFPLKGGGTMMMMRPPGSLPSSSSSSSLAASDAYLQNLSDTLKQANAFSSAP